MRLTGRVINTNLPLGGRLEMRKSVIIALATFVAVLMLLSALPLTSSEDNGRAKTKARDIIYFDDFSSSTDWTLHNYWEIGVLGPNPSGFNGADPLHDHSPTFDNQCLGSRVPGAFRGQYYQYRWAVSPIIDCSNFGEITITHWAHDHTDYILWQNWYLEVRDHQGTWQRLWYGYYYPGVSDINWRLFGPIDVSLYADDNPNFQIRFGYYCRSGVYTTAGRNIDDLTVEGIPIGIPADINIEPQTLNLGSQGNYINIKVENFPDNPEYTPNDVDPATVTISGMPTIEKFGTSNDNRFIIKADRLTLEDSIGLAGDIELEIKGGLYDGTIFKGTVTIRVT